MFNPSLQWNGHQLRHLLAIESLPLALLEQLLKRANEFLENNFQDHEAILKNKTVVNLFFENSTRTRTTFEMAAVGLGAAVVNFNVAISATSKGESLLDTIYNLTAMGCHLLVVRHACSGAAAFIAQAVDEQIPVINAGDGCHAHPTQALLDMLTIQRAKGSIEGLTCAIVGDIKHSRVARSDIQALHLLGARQIRIIAPDTLLPDNANSWGVHVYRDMDKALQNVDVIIMLRLQKERMDQAFIPSQAEYFARFGLTQERLALAAPDAVVLHPGPLNRGVEMDSKVAEGKQSLILEQVTVGKAIRMAVMEQLLRERNK